MRGLINTYNTYDEGIKATITEINVRHDGSGRYPGSVPDDLRRIFGWRKKLPFRINSNTL